MVNITPPSSNSGTPARPVSPVAEATMDVDSAPHSPSVQAATPAEASSRNSPVPVAMLARNASDTEDDDVAAAGAPPAQGATAAAKNSSGIWDASASRQIDADKGSRGKNRDMFDSEIVDRWNQEFGDVFAAPAASAQRPVATSSS